MKRVISLIVTALLAVNVVCAKGFFSNRIFELKVDVPVNVSNNDFSLNDVLVKDLVIDLKKIADDMPKSGFNLIMETSPSVAANLNIFGISVGTKVGANAFVKLNLEKDLFDFLGYGYKPGDNLNIAANPVADIFAFAEVPVGFKVKSFKLSVTPSLFLPIASVDDCNIGVTAYNLADGTVGAKLNADINFYTSALYDVAMGNATIDSISFGDYVGFDLGASMEMPFLTEDLDLRIDARIPLYPGKLDKKGTINYKYDFETKISDFVMPEETPAEPNPAEPKPAEPAKPEPAEPDFTPKITNLVDPYVINRPLKLNAYAVYQPIGFFTLVGGGGV